MDNLPEPELQKNICFIKVYANEILLLNKGFKNREKRNYWMERMSVTLEGITNAYFELSYGYNQRKEPKYEYNKRNREFKKRLLQMKAPEEVSLAEQRPPTAYSNTQWNEL